MYIYLHISRYAGVYEYISMIIMHFNIKYLFGYKFYKNIKNVFYGENRVNIAPLISIPQNIL